MEAPLVSIVIDNYNYAQFLPSAIESALNQSYPRCEVIVVDDGSQDGSVEVITGFGDRIRPVLKENGGQSSALNAGFESSRGEIVIFLDADDRLERVAASQIAGAFLRQPEAVRVQYRLALIDGAGNLTGGTKPAAHVPVPYGDIRQQVLCFPFDAAWLPTSGNAFSARVLRQIMPIPLEYGRINADYYLVHTSPIWGPVLFIDEILACFRVHGANYFENIDSTLDLERLRTTIQYDELTYQWIRRHAQKAGLARWFEVPEQNYSVSSAASRLTSLKLEPSAHPLIGDRTVPLMVLGIRSALGRFDTSPAVRLVFVTWFILMGLASGGLARWLADLFFFPERRQAFTRLLGQLHYQRSIPTSWQQDSLSGTLSRASHSTRPGNHAEGGKG